MEYSSEEDSTTTTSHHVDNQSTSQPEFRYTLQKVCLSQVTIEEKERERGREQERGRETERDKQNEAESL